VLLTLSDSARSFGSTTRCRDERIACANQHLAQGSGTCVSDNENGINPGNKPPHSCEGIVDDRSTYLYVFYHLRLQHVRAKAYTNRYKQGAMMHEAPCAQGGRCSTAVTLRRGSAPARHFLLYLLHG
jgi:hypothetical protein